jgi:hypothetical protein
MAQELLCELNLSGGTCRDRAVVLALVMVQYGADWESVTVNDEARWGREAGASVAQWWDRDHWRDGPVKFPRVRDVVAAWSYLWPGHVWEVNAFDVSNEYSETYRYKAGEPVTDAEAEAERRATAKADAAQAGADKPDPEFMKTLDEIAGEQ